MRAEQSVPQHASNPRRRHQPRAWLRSVPAVPPRLRGSAAMVSDCGALASLRASFSRSHSRFRRAVTASNPSRPNEVGDSCRAVPYSCSCLALEGRPAGAGLLEAKRANTGGAGARRRGVERPRSSGRAFQRQRPRRLAPTRHGVPQGESFGGVLPLEARRGYMRVNRPLWAKVNLLQADMFSEPVAHVPFATIWYFVELPPLVCPQGTTTLFA